MAAQKYVDQVVAVDDENLNRAQKLLLTEGCIFAEPMPIRGTAA